MFHLATFTTGTLGNATPNTDVPALPDGILTVNPANHFIMPKPLEVYAAYAASATLLRTRLQSPRIRQTNPAYLRPIQTGPLPGNNPNLAWFGDDSINFLSEEDIAMEATCSAAGPERFTGHVWLVDGFQAVPTGDAFRVRWTSVTAVVANAWTLLAVTFETTLPVGQYVLVGGEHISTNGLAFRCVMDNLFWRPGMLSINANTQRGPRELYQRNLGVWGSFRSVSMPRIEVLANAADAAHEGYLEVIRTGN